MKHTLKLRRAIEDAMISGMCDAINRHCPEIDGNPPDTWDDDTRRRFDLITDVEMSISLAVKKALDS